MRTGKRIVIIAGVPDVAVARNMTDGMTRRLVITATLVLCQRLMRRIRKKPVMAARRILGSLMARGVRPSIRMDRFWSARKGALMMSPFAILPQDKREESTAESISASVMLLRDENNANARRLMKLIARIICRI